MLDETIQNILAAEMELGSIAISKETWKRLRAAGAVMPSRESVRGLVSLSVPASEIERVLDRVFDCSDVQEARFRGGLE